MDCGVDTSVWKSEYEFDTSFHAAKNALKAGVRAVEALNTPALRGMRSEEARGPEVSSPRSQPAKTYYLVMRELTRKQPTPAGTYFD